MFIIDGVFRISDLARARPHMEAMIAASRAEQGCIEYAYAIDVLDSTLVRVHEIWESRAHHAAHNEAPHFKAWRAAWPQFGGGDRKLAAFDARPEELKTKLHK